MRPPVRALSVGAESVDVGIAEEIGLVARPSRTEGRKRKADPMAKRNPRDSPGATLSRTERHLGSATRKDGTRIAPAFHGPGRCAEGAPQTPPSPRAHCARGHTALSFPSMKLYSMNMSNNCRRVNATIQHLGLDVQVVEQTMPDLKKPEFLALNPNGKVPTLVDGDLTLWESRAIMQYVASKKPGNTLWPNDPKGQANIARWQFWEAAHLSKGTGAYAFEKLFKKIFMKMDPDPVALAVGEKEWRTFAPVLNAQLEARKWIIGDVLTLADFSVGACFSYAEPSGLPWDDYKHIKAWWGRLGEIPAWKNTAPKLA